MLYESTQSAEPVLETMRGLTHTLKGTVGLIRAVAASNLVQPKARQLLEQVAVRLQESCQAVDAAHKEA